MDRVDLFVIGGGSGGVRAARMAAAAGASVVLAESGRLGGTCVNVGCIPKKLYSYAAHFRHDFEDSAGYGWDAGNPRFNWSALVAAKQREITRLNGIYEGLLQKAGVRLVNGHARLKGPGRVEVSGREFEPSYVLLATGGRPQIPDFAGNDLVVTSDAVFDLPQFPARILIVGGGYIAVEFAGIFAGLGAEVTLSFRGEHLLRGFDEDLRLRFERAARSYATLLPNSQLVSLSRAGKAFEAVLADGSRLQVDCVLMATGRRANTAGVGLETTAVSLAADGTVQVDARLATAEPSIYALGDLVGRKPLTPVALAEGMLVADQLFGAGKRRLSYEQIPTTVFSQPNLGTVGLTEAQALERYAGVQIFDSEFRPLRHTLSGRDEAAYMKIVVDTASDRVLGMHMLGPDAGEVIQGFAAAMTAGLTKSQLDATIGIHPTLAEEFVTMRTPARTLRR